MPSAGLESKVRIKYGSLFKRSQHTPHMHRNWEVCACPMRPVDV